MFSLPANKNTPHMNRSGSVPKILKKIKNRRKIQGTGSDNPHPIFDEAFAKKQL